MQAFIINLKRSKDRKAHILKEISKLYERDEGLKDILSFNFFEAVDGARLEGGGQTQNFVIFTIINSPFIY